jgi:hypothetical protein
MLLLSTDPTTVFGGTTITGTIGGSDADLYIGCYPAPIGPSQLINSGLIGSTPAIQDPALGACWLAVL